MLQRELRVGSVQFVIAPVIVFPNLYSWLDGLVCCCVAATRWNVSKTPIDFLTCSIVNRAFRLSPEKLLATRFFFRLGDHFIMKRNFLKLSIENLFLKSLQNENTPKEDEENKKLNTKTTFRARPSTGCSWETTNANVVVSDFV